MVIKAFRVDSVLVGDDGRPKYNASPHYTFLLSLSMSQHPDASKKDEEKNAVKKRVIPE